jgi:hypothetical protein
MKKPIAGMAITALLTIGVTVAAHAEDAVPPAAAGPAAAPSEAPVNVPRPSIVAPKTAEPARTTEPAKATVPGAAPPLADPSPRRYRRHAHRHYRRDAFWSPIPIYWPYIHRHRIYWSRVSWFGF